MAEERPYISNQCEYIESEYASSQHQLTLAPAGLPVRRVFASAIRL